MIEKCCTKCGQAKPISEYHKDKSRADGLSLYCKRCKSIRAREHYTKNREQINARNSKWRRQNCDKVRVYRAKHYAENAEMIKVQGAMYRMMHQFGEKVRNAKYQKDNPDRARANSNRRRARKMSAAGDATAEQIAARWEVYGNTCYICGGPAEATDHVKPLAKGGSNWPANLRPICTHCNAVKGHQWPYVFSLTKTVESPRFDQISYSGD